MINKELYQRILEKLNKLDALRPINKAALQKLQETFRVEMTYNSNAIEGNTLSLSETKLVLEEGLTIGGKTLNEHLEATNHSKAMELLQTLVEKKEVCENDVLNIHAIILDRIDPQNAGFYRRGSVRISGTTYTPPNAVKVPQLMQEFYKLLNSRGNTIEVAAEVHQKFVDIHPFIDGNGRTARLLMNLYLMRNRYPPVIILKNERRQYIESITKWQMHNQAQNFVNFIAKAVERSLNMYLDTLGDENNEYISLSEAATISKNNYSSEYLSLLARKGKIGAVKFGRNWKITKKELEEYERKTRD